MLYFSSRVHRGDQSTDSLYQSFVVSLKLPPSWDRILRTEIQEAVVRGCPHFRSSDFFNDFEDKHLSFGLAPADYSQTHWEPPLRPWDLDLSLTKCILPSLQLFACEMKVPYPRSCVSLVISLGSSGMLTLAANAKDM